ncbi:glycosyltransferase family 39 protein [Candidatus Saganbacteria bacterium]|nr:glycosyltransferase family 39 protein [Candidatus Saganbacteria bacterium]
MYFFVFLAGITFFKIILSPYFPLIGDEAYYWLWSKHPALSYIDHPPMIAYVNFIISALFGNSEAAIRLTAIFIVTAVAGIIYLTGKELYDRRSGQLAAVIFSLLPLFFGGGFFLVPQMLLFLFWSWSFYLIIRIIKTKNPDYWYCLGVTAGLGFLSDYVMALFFIGTLIFLAVNPETRFWFKKAAPYAAVIISLVIFSPVIIWNLSFGFTPLFYWGGKMGAGPRLADNLLNFFGLQMLLYTPVIFLATIFMVLREKKSKMLKIYSAVVFLPFLLISPIMNVGGHWPAAAYLPAILNSPRLKKAVFALAIFLALIVNGLGLGYYAFFYPTPVELQGREFTINKNLPQYIKGVTPGAGKTYYLGNDLGILGLVAFHGHVPVNMAPRRLRQVDLWGKLEIRRGDNVIYFALNETPLLEKLKPLFIKVKLEPQKRLFNKDADLPNKLQIFICETFRGGNLP